MAAFLSCGGTAGAQTPTWTAIHDVPGKIENVDATRVLFVQEDGDLAIENRKTEAVTVLTDTPGFPGASYLSPHGAIFEAATPGPYAGLYEWRDGSVLDLGRAQGLRVAGAYAEWSISTDLFRRDLNTGVTTQVSSNAGNTQNDIAANGDLVFWTGDFSVERNRGGTTTLLAAGTADAWQTYPRTDGINVVWREHAPCCLAPSGSLRAFGPSGPFTLANTQRAGAPEPDVDYRVAGGWIAFTRGEAGAKTIWIRDPSGTEAPLSGPGTNSILALSETGEVLFGDGSQNARVGNPGGDPIPAGRLPEDFQEAFFSGGHWFARTSDAIHRLSLTDAPTDGSQTAIDSAPQGTVSSDEATFEFSSTVPGSSTFECRLGAADWAPCTSPQSYMDLADGPHTFTVRSVHGGEVDPVPASQTWISDVTAPAVTLTTPLWSSATSDTTPPFEGHAGTARGDSPTVTVDIFAGGSATGTPVQSFATTRLNDDWSASVPTALAEGMYTARARQDDDAGHTGVSEPETFAVDDKAPQPFALQSPADGAQDRSPSPQFMWEAATDTGTGVTRYELWIDSEKDRDVSPSVCSGGSCSSQPLQPRGHGAHTWQVRAFDGVGHLRSSETRGFGVDTSAPAEFALTAPTAGERTADATPTLRWAAATDAESGIDHYEVWIDEERIAADVNGTEFTPAALADGSHTWRVHAIDGAGNSRATATRGFSVDTTAPGAALAVGPAVLAGDDVVLDASASSDPAGGTITRYEWDLDGNGSFERDGGSVPTTTTSYSTPRELRPAVRVTDAGGLTSERSAPLSVRTRPPAGQPGVSINGGDRYTDDPDVTVDVVWTPLSTALLIANDGGFADAEPRALATPIPWTLDSSGSERLPRTIYVRFTDGGRETYQDDIILDETAPTVTARFVAKGRRLRVVARDNVSGVLLMQVTKNRHRPGLARRYRRITKAPRGRAAVFTRVRDGAGNWSRWKRAAR